MYRLALILVGLCTIASGQEPITYNRDTLVPLFQTGQLTAYPQLFNPSRTNTHPHGSPNNHFPWLHPGGVPEGQQVTTIKELTLPPDGKIRVRLIDGTPPPRYQTWTKLYSWTFPTGTVAKIRLFHEGREFAQHISTKTGDGHGIKMWDGEELIVGTPPKWYTSVDNCTKCHEDIGKHARVLRPRDEDYYYWLRGSDGRFSWHPFENIDPKRMTAAALQIRNDPQIIVETP